MRKLLARIAYRLLRPEIEALTDPWVKAQREMVEAQRKQLLILQQQGPLLKAMAKVMSDTPSVRGLGGLARY